MAINRKSFSSIIPADQQAKMAKVIVCNTTPRGYLHIVTVRTDIVNEQEVEKFTDVMIHPDRAPFVDVAKFDAVSLQGLTPRNAAGEPKANTTYHWGQDVKAIGRHLVEQAIVGDTPGTEKQVLVYAGVGIYGDAPVTLRDKGFGSDDEQS